MPLPSALGACECTTAAPTARDGAKDILCLYCLSTNTFATPPTCLLPSLPRYRSPPIPPRRRARVHPAGHLRCRHTSGANCGPTAPWPSFALLQPAAVTMIVVLVAGVHGQRHHPGKPVQAGGVFDLSLPVPTRCVVAFLAMVLPPPPLPLMGGEDEAHSTNTNISPIRSAKQEDVYGASNIVLPCPGS